MLLWCGLASAQVDLSTLDRGMAGPRAKVLVLGSVHLSQLPKDADFDPASLQPVLDRLAAFKPGVITIEAISGEQCDLAARNPSVYGADLGGYCRDTVAAKTATGLDVPAAIAAVRKTLRSWPATPTAAQRRHLAALFLAANERASALAQWWQLAPAERRAGDGLDAALVVQLDKLAASNNESYQIGARLAARLGLQRVYAVDDHTGDNIQIDDEAAYGKTIQALWDRAAPRAKATRERQDRLARSGDMLGLYRDINLPASQQLAVETDFGAALRDASPEHYGQRYVAGWEGRNLRMAANIRVAFADHPGARVLSIVGASHKPWLDKLLGQMQGVDIVDAETVLQDPGRQATTRRAGAPVAMTTTGQPR